MRAFYFGLLSASVPLLYEPQKFEGQPIHQRVRFSGNNPWGELILGTDMLPKFRVKGLERLAQGVAHLHINRGWTAIAFRDWSMSDEPDSKSVFIVEGIHDFGPMLTIAKQKFPSIMARFKFPIVEVKRENVS